MWRYWCYLVGYAVFLWWLVAGGIGCSSVKCNEDGNVTVLSGLTFTDHVIPPDACRNAKGAKHADNR